jgi:hypothetical protein
LSFRGAPLLVIPRSAATRNLLGFCTVSRCRFVRAVSVLRPLIILIILIIHAKGIPQLRISHYVRNDSGKRGIPRSTPACHSEERLFVIPRSASDEGSLETCNHFPPYSQLQIPHFVRNDTGKGAFRGAPLLVIPRSAATRDLLKLVTTSRRIPNCRFLTSFGMTREKGHSEEHFFVIPRSAATRDLLKFVTTSRRIPNCRFLTSFGMTREKGHSEEHFFVIPRSAATRNLLEFCTVSRCRFVRAVFVLRPQIILIILIIHAKGIPQLRISHYVRNDTGKGAFRGALFCHSEERSDEESPRILHRFPL